MNWRDVPSLSALRAFEATARLSSFSAAARELNVTHAAIAQHVRALEVDLGETLVFRSGAGMALTASGQQLAGALSDGFGAIAAGVSALRVAKSDKPLRVSLTPSFAENWLMPKIAAFWAKHPDIQLALQPSMQVEDLRRGAFDLALRYGHGKWPGVEAEMLAPANFIVVATPELAEKLPDTSMAELCNLPWILETGRDEQRLWAGQVGLDLSCTSFTELPTNALVLAATRAGSGLSIQTRAVVEDDLSIGRLVCLHASEPSTLGYYLVRVPGMRSVPLDSFVRWLKSVAKA